MVVKIGFTSIDELYSYLEENILELKDYQIANLFKELKNLKFSENNLEEAKKAQLEQLFFDFNLIYGKNALFSDKEGKLLKVYDLINPDDYNYFIERLSKAENPCLKSHYAKILWFSPLKHAKYGYVVVDSNFELFRLYKEKLVNNTFKQELELSNCLKNAYTISHQLNYKNELIKSELLSMIRLNGFFNNLVVSCSLIINWIWELRKKFDNEDFNGLDDVCWKLAKNWREEDLHASIDILELGFKIEQKLQTNNYKWKKEIAIAHERIMNKNEEKDKFIAIKHCLLSIDNYKISKDFEKVAELEEKYNKLNKDINYKKASFKFDYGIFLKTINEEVEDILKYDPKEIILILMLSEKLLPYHVDLNKMTQENAQKLPILAASNKVVMDQSGHPSEYFLTEKDKKYFDLIFNYKIYLELYNAPLITKILLDSIAKNKLSAKILINFLKDKSWINKDLNKQTKTQKFKYNWLAGITPAIIDYFRQIEIYMINPEHANFILCVDSFVLKIEGIIRDLCKFNKIVTSKPDKNNKLVKKEKNINDLLYENKLKKVLSIDELLFLRVLLIEQSGYNLRNRIAHSLIEPHDYTVYTANLLLFALLRLFKYEWKDRSTNNQVTEI